MPCARQRVGKPLRDIDAVEASSTYRIMGSEATEKPLDEEHRQHHEQPFTERALRWRTHRERQPIPVRRADRRVAMHIGSPSSRARLGTEVSFLVAVVLLKQKH